MALDDAYSVALLHMDGADASTTFTDESGKTWTRQGNAQIDTAQSVFGGASGLFDGTGDYLTAADHADWQLDGGSDSNAWTIDLRVRWSADPGTAREGLVQQFQSTSNYWAFYLGNNLLTFVIRSAGTNIVAITNAFNPAANTWYHIAIVKNGTTGYLMFVDGTQVGTTQTDTDPMPDFTGGMQVGRLTDSAGANLDFTGWMDELRISKGIARWTSNFTPPTAEYAPASPNTGAFFIMF